MTCDILEKYYQKRRQVESFGEYFGMKEKEELKQIESQIESKLRTINNFPELTNIFKNKEGKIIKILIKEDDKFKELNMNFGYPIPTTEITLENHLKKESKLASLQYVDDVINDFGIEKPLDLHLAETKQELSQHKKLVDAIQKDLDTVNHDYKDIFEMSEETIKEIQQRRCRDSQFTSDYARMFTSHLREKLQNLLKESEKE